VQDVEKHFHHDVDLKVEKYEEESKYEKEKRNERRIIDQPELYNLLIRHARCPFRYECRIWSRCEIENLVNEPCFYQKDYSCYSEGYYILCYNRFVLDKNVKYFEYNAKKKRFEWRTETFKILL
jgi:hypothetical protein